MRETVSIISDQSPLKKISDQSVYSKEPRSASSKVAKYKINKKRVMAIYI